jgi:hypothetical protein
MKGMGFSRASDERCPQWLKPLPSKFFMYGLKAVPFTEEEFSPSGTTYLRG